MIRRNSTMLQPERVLEAAGPKGKEQERAPRDAEPKRLSQPRQADAIRAPGRWLSRRPAFVLTGVLLGTLLIHCLTLTRSPTVWTDEVMIVEYGRVLSDPDTPWSVTLNEHRTAALPMVPVYPWLQQKWLAMTGVNPSSVRLLSSLCGCGAVLAFYGLLRSQGIRPWNGVLLGLALWFDVVFVGSFRGARGDAFALALCFLACWAWQRSLERRSLPLGLLAGAAAVVALLSWPTSAAFLVLGLTCYGEFALKRRSLRLPQAAMAVTGLTVVLAAFYCAFSPLLERVLVPGGAKTYSLAHLDPLRLGRVLVGCYWYTPLVLVWSLAAVAVCLKSRRNLPALLALVGARWPAARRLSIAGASSTWRRCFTTWWAGSSCRPAGCGYCSCSW